MTLAPSLPTVISRALSFVCCADEAQGALP